MKIGCIVMAAGNARRFGSNKLDARVEGKTLLRRALEGDHGGSAVIRRHPDLLLLVEAPPQELTDVDTPQALEVLTGEKCR